MEGREAKKRRKIGRLGFTDGVERDVFEDAEGRQFAEDAGELLAGQWLPPADEPTAVVDCGGGL
jgi:hypothetical protein